MALTRRRFYFQNSFFLQNGLFSVYQNAESFKDKHLSRIVITNKVEAFYFKEMQVLWHLELMEREGTLPLDTVRANSCDSSSEDQVEHHAYTYVLILHRTFEGNDEILELEEAVSIGDDRETAPEMKRYDEELAKQSDLIAFRNGEKMREFEVIKPVKDEGKIRGKKCKRVFKRIRRGIGKAVRRMFCCNV